MPTAIRAARILLVHRNVHACEHLCALFCPDAGDANYIMRMAIDQASALQLAASEHPDVILIAVEAQSDSEAQPVEGGLGSPGFSLAEASALIGEIRKLEGDRHTGVICLVSRNTQGESQVGVSCLEAGADDFLDANRDFGELRARVTAAMRWKRVTDELRRANHRLRLLSLTDELTGLANMRQFNQRFAELVRSCRSGDHGVGVVMVDLDHFKAVNDNSNHLVGSFVIAEVGRLIRDSGLFKAPRGIAARYGGDEFIAAMAADGIPEVVTAAEALRKCIGSASFLRDGFVIHITASIGVAWVHPGCQGSAEELIKAADLMLYRSKALGRDRVTGLALDDREIAALDQNDRGRDDRSDQGLPIVKKIAS